MDPRIQRTRDAVLPATLSVLASRGFASFTMEAVAEAAGVAKSTVYRYWPTKLALLRDALEGLNRQPDAEFAAGPARARIERLLEHLAGALSDSVFSACIPALVEAAEHHPEVAEFLHGYSDRRRAALTAVIRQGVDAGELPAHLDPELAALALSGPFFYRRLMTASPLPAADVPRLVRQVLGPDTASTRGEPR
ncbi:MAG TPA: TetR/AcrR family transcriptional regulator C-terminal ligand-binding domain-containing protein [Longimicrobium sp.]|nr:TetR/AcrR family transcriptional regulator C-terminal ligand-binding domain-containing protein [Longimicrobium sp.]